MNEYLTANQVAQRLGVTRNRVYKLRQSRGTGVMLGDQWVFTEADVQNMVPDAKHRRKDYSIVPPPHVVVPGLDAKLERGIWILRYGVKYKASLLDGQYRLEIGGPDDIQTDVYSDRDEFLARLRQVEPDLRKWRLARGPIPN